MTDFEPETCEFILNLLRFALTHNFFLFGDLLYLQIQGTAMGAACAPSYANCFLGLWERRIFMLEPPALIEKVSLWGRFIDDILFVWHGSIDELGSFMDQLNNNNYNIKLTYKYGRTNMEFLDVLFNIESDGYISSNVYRKKTSTNSLLHATSSHPKPLISNIPVGQFLRMKRICSSDTFFEEQAKDLTNRFKERGYRQQDISKAYSRAKNTPRNNLLMQPKQKNPDNQGATEKSKGTCSEHRSSQE
ncbi:uncharacterized protein LOC130293541 [Hyla sarda]|nr:uncharacterized protein LOC130293541 [Hyla sarda]